MDFSSIFSQYQEVMNNLYAYSYITATSSTFAAFFCGILLQVVAIYMIANCKKVAEKVLLIILCIVIGILTAIVFIRLLSIPSV